MKQRTLIIALCSFLLMSFCVSKNAIKYEKGAAVVNTTSIVKARGFRGKTPVKIYIRNGKVQKIVALPNQDTPSVFAQAETCRRGGADEGGRRERCHLLVESPHTERKGRTEILPREQEVEFLT